MSLTPRELNRATLARQLLLDRQALAPVEAVRRVVAIQAQEPASPYLALWTRVEGLDPAEVDAAIASHAVVKASLLRLTLHLVTVEDHAAFRAAMEPNLRASRLHDRRFTSTGLSAADADVLVPELLRFLEVPRTSTEVETFLSAELGVTEPRVWWALRTYAPIVHAPVGGPWAFGQRNRYRAAPAPSSPVPHEAGVRALVRRYLEGFGPATRQDIAQFTLLRQTQLGPALDALADELLACEGPGGTTLYDVPDAPLPDGDTPAPARFLPMWDSTLLAYADRSRILPDEHRPVVIRRNGDVLPSVLVDGAVAGVWRPARGGIEVTVWSPLGDGDWDELAGEATRLLAFLADRDPGVHSRYGRWWRDLPAGEVRVLGA